MAPSVGRTPAEPTSTNRETSSGEKAASSAATQPPNSLPTRVTGVPTTLRT